MRENGEIQFHGGEEDDDETEDGEEANTRFLPLCIIFLAELNARSLLPIQRFMDWHTFKKKKKPEAKLQLGGESQRTSIIVTFSYSCYVPAALIDSLLPTLLARLCVRSPTPPSRPILISEKAQR